MKLLFRTALSLEAESVSRLLSEHGARVEGGGPFWGMTYPKQGESVKRSLPYNKGNPSLG